MVAWLITISLSISVALADESSILLTPATVITSAKNIECGTYWISGKFNKISHDSSSLELYPETTRRFPIVLSGVHPIDGSILNKRFVKAKVKVTKVINGGIESMQFSAIEKPVTITRTEALREPIEKIADSSCEQTK